MAYSISVIIPVYKVEQYIDRCIQSVINQTVLPDEIILVDDGSPDRCGLICDEYAGKYEYIRVVHKKNGGLSDARNVGIMSARSDYLLFLDSDDSISSETIEHFADLLANLEAKPDVVPGRIISFWPDRTNVKSHSIADGKEYDGQSFLKRELITKSMIYESVHCLYCREFLISNNLLFVKGLLHEDQLFTMSVFLKAQSVVPTNICFYNHYIREESITTQRNQIPNAESIIRICHLMEYTLSSVTDAELRHRLYDHCVDLYYKVYVDAYLEQHRDIVLKTSYLIKNSHSLKNRLRTAIYLVSKKLFSHIERERRCLL